MYTPKKLLTLLFIISTLNAFAQHNATDSFNRHRAKMADSLAQLHKNRKYKFDSAEFYGKRAVTLRRRLADKEALANSLTILGDIYYTRKKYKEASDLYKQSARIARQLGNLDLEKKALELLIKNEKRADNFKNAFYYQGLIHAMDDSLLNAVNEERAREIVALKKQIEHEKVQHENKTLRQQQEIDYLQSAGQQLLLMNQNYLRIAVIALSVIGAFILVLLYRSYRLNRKLRRERMGAEMENQERMAIAKDIREDLALGLSRINSLSQEVFYKPATGESKKNINVIIELSDRLIENTRDLVWQLNSENTSLSNLIGRLRDYSTESLRDHAVEILFRSPDTVPDVQLRKIAHRNIFLTVKEALNNIIKHAHALNVDITITLKGDYLNITIQDDGVGHDFAAESAGQGLKNIKERIQSIGGLLNVVSEEQSTSVRMDIRLSQIVKH